jgi:hypothetical protein
VSGTDINPNINGGLAFKSWLYNGRAYVLGKNPANATAELWRSDATFQAYTAVTALALSDANYQFAMEFVPDA